MPGLFTGGDRRAKDLPEAVRGCGHRLRKVRAFHDACAQCHRQRALAVVFVLFGQRAKRFVDRQARADQGRELAREDGELAARQCPPAKRGTRAARGGNLLDGERIEPAFAQAAAHRARGVALQDTPLGTTAAVESLVCEGGHARCLHGGNSTIVTGTGAGS